MHAARNFALQEHAVENTESVSLPHTTIWLQHELGYIA